jgi:hypothetical protein
MERSIAKQVNFGRSCLKCKVYFVTSDPSLYICPWCLQGGPDGVLDGIYDPRGREHGRIKK